MSRASAAAACAAGVGNCVAPADASAELGPRQSAGTNASADFGTAMLVGVTLPSPGCWRLTATYLDASLSIVVLVEGD